MKPSITVLRAAMALLPVGGWLAAPCVATEPAGERGVTRDAVVTGVDYARKWAVIIGCDYAGHPNPRSVPPLRSAESDARAVFEELTRNYGYEAGRTCFLLLCSEANDGRATRDRILARLKDVVGRCNTEAGSGLDAQKHSLLFFFAGHGSGFRKGRAAYGKLYPADVTVDVSGAEPVMGNTLFIPEIVEYIAGCRAFHKLMVLDCCESGLLFEDFKVASSESAERAVAGGVTRADFSAAALVGLTAGTQVERVKDAADLLPGHSPFTGALLRALGSALGEPAAGPFAATEVYVDITRQLERYNATRPEAPVTQRPQIGKLPVGMAGDFFFVPRAGFAPARPGAAGAHPTLAGLGGLTGQAWMDQWPWFTPAVRAALPAIDRGFGAGGGPGLEARLRAALELPADVLVVDAPPAALMESLHDVLEGHRLGLDDPEPCWHDFVTLSNAEIVPVERATLLGELLDRITANPTAADLHLAALLESRLDREADADQHFTAALKLLAADPAAKPLLTLCRLDHAQHLLATNRWRECAAACEQVRRAAGDTPGTEYLQIEAAHVQVAALRKRHRLRDAEELFSDPIANLVGRLASRGVALHPMLACLAERHAWCLMDQWRLAEATAQFERSVDLRGRLGGSAAPAGSTLVHRLNQLHSKHGLAMIAHFTCATDAAGPLASRRYEEIVGLCDALLPRPAIEEALVLERAVNSLERHADSLLFLPSQAMRRPARAAGHLTQAIRREKVRQRRTGGDILRSPLARLHLKRSIAMLLAGDPSAAAEDRSAADALLRSPGADAPDRIMRLLVGIADTVGGHADGAATVVATAAEMANAASASPTVASREEVDVALFGLAIAAHSEAAAAAEARDRLVTLLDTFNELGGERVPLLRYLRRYRDEIVASMAIGGDSAAVELTDAVLAARGGDPFGNTDEDAATVLVHAYEDERGWLAVVQPAGGAARGEGRVVTFAGRLPAREPRGAAPADLVAAVGELAGAGGGVIVDWADPVLGISNDDYPFTLPDGWSLAPDGVARNEAGR